jgi:hypothetical protein
MKKLVLCDATVVGSRRDVADSLRCWLSAIRSVEFAAAALPAAPAVEELEGCCPGYRAHHLVPQCPAAAITSGT